MRHIAIDEEKCIGCGQCVKDCGTSVLYLENGKAKAKDDGCVKCGHCFAICPNEAISMPEYDCSDCDQTARSLSLTRIKCSLHSSRGAPFVISRISRFQRSRYIKS
ncbi:MAG: 4Fe-4S binding protein [Clostridia bacterium]|nr:4Fe-4S binding protein [Clostridia bacterium]